VAEVTVQAEVVAEEAAQEFLGVLFLEALEAAVVKVIPAEILLVPLMVVLLVEMLAQKELAEVAQETPEGQVIPAQVRMELVV
jgi:hypothetical protein